MLLLGIDLGTSSIKVAVVEAATQTCLASVRYPDEEVNILVPHAGWAEQSPALWWEHTKKAIQKCNATMNYDPKNIGAIGISYQMHGLVVVDEAQKVLRDAIIWCDSRAVNIGNEAFEKIGKERSLSHLLNSPGNFTASKLAWVKANEPQVYKRINKMLLPGDFISMQLTGEITTTSSALSEGILWDFQENTIADEVINCYELNRRMIPVVNNLFSSHGDLKADVANELSLTTGIPVTYKAGDQLNNAFSLNVLLPGEVAATAGTSGVIYAVTDELNYDPQSRVNSFAHVNHSDLQKRIGVLLCINGTGILNRWIRNLAGFDESYEQLNAEAASIAAGSDGLMVLPFGNGAERMLGNKVVGAHIHHLDFNIHSRGHIVRAAQEGIAFAFRYGLDIMREMNMDPAIIKAGRTNMFLSNVFTRSFVNATGVPVHLYNTDGSIGAALGAGVGIKYFKNENEAFSRRKALETIEPTGSDLYDELYMRWKALLDQQLQEQALPELIN